MSMHSSSSRTAVDHRLPARSPHAQGADSNPAAGPVSPRSELVRRLAKLASQEPVTVCTAIYNEKGVKLIDRGVRVDATLYERLQQHRLLAPIETCVKPDNMVTPAQVAAEAAHLLEKHPLIGRLCDPNRLSRLAPTLLGKVPLPHGLAVHLTTARALHKDLFDHSILASLACIALGAYEFQTEYDRVMLAAVGLFHDLGMLHTDEAILAGTQHLTAAQRRHITVHPLTSAMLVQSHREFPSTVMNAVLQHHERLDGTGYPKGLAGSALTPWGRIASVAALVTSSLRGGGLVDEVRLETLMRLNATQFDPAIRNAVSRACSDGNKLSVGLYAVVSDELESAVTALGDLLVEWHQCADAASEDQRMQAALQRMTSVGIALAKVGLDKLLLHSSEILAGAGAPERAELTLVVGEVHYQLLLAAQALQESNKDGPTLPQAVMDWAQAVSDRKLANETKMNRADE